MYIKDFEIRWNDIDANGHLANAAYINYMSHTRMGFLQEHGFSLIEMNKNGIGPVVFYEHVYYFKESFIGKPIKVSLEVAGLSEDGMFFKFKHNFYNENGENLATADIFGAWMNLKTRKLTSLPDSLLNLAELFPKSDEFKILTKMDAREHGKFPRDLD